MAAANWFGDNVSILLNRNGDGTFADDVLYGTGDAPYSVIAADVLRGDMPLAHWVDTEGGFLLDVRNPAELAAESAPGAVNIPQGCFPPGFSTACQFTVTVRAVVCARNGA